MFSETASRSWVERLDSNHTQEEFLSLDYCEFSGPWVPQSVYILHSISSPHPTPRGRVSICWGGGAVPFSSFAFSGVLPGRTDCGGVRLGPLQWLVERAVRGHRGAAPERRAGGGHLVGGAGRDGTWRRWRRRPPSTRSGAGRRRSGRAKQVSVRGAERRGAEGQRAGAQARGG